MYKTLCLKIVPETTISFLVLFRALSHKEANREKQKIAIAKNQEFQELQQLKLERIEKEKQQASLV